MSTSLSTGINELLKQERDTKDVSLACHNNTHLTQPYPIHTVPAVFTHQRSARLEHPTIAPREEAHGERLQTQKKLEPVSTADTMCLQATAARFRNS